MVFEEANRITYLLSEVHAKATTTRMKALTGGSLAYKHLLTRHSRLFHYTTISGLMGIIDTGALWLTNTQYMNDLSEQKHSLEIIKKTISSLCLSDKYSDRFKKLLSSDSPERNSMEALYSKPAYVACFTDDGDSLHMWGMYGGASGVSIEFDLDSGYKFVFGPNCFFEDMLYSNDTLESTVIAIVDEYYKEYAIDESRGDIAHLTMIEEVYKSEIFGATFHCCINFKHMAFHNEKETRLHYMPKDNEGIKFRDKNNFIIPYFEMPPKELNGDEKLPIISITVGPCSEQKLTTKSILDFMKSKGYDVDIKESSIPYISR